MYEECPNTKGMGNYVYTPKTLKLVLGAFVKPTLFKIRLEIFIKAEVEQWQLNMILINSIRQNA